MIETNCRAMFDNCTYWYNKGKIHIQQKKYIFASFYSHCAVSLKNVSRKKPYHESFHIWHQQFACISFFLFEYAE